MKNKKICGVPFYEMAIYQDAEDESKIMALPCCKSWLKKPYTHNGYIPVREDNPGNLDIMEAWNSYRFIYFRKSIINGTYEFCDLDSCPNYKSNNLQKIPEIAIPLIEKNTLNLNYAPILIRVCCDNSCNLSCRSCRPTKIQSPFPKSYHRLKSILSSGTKNIFINGGGELFANEFFLKAINEFSSQKYPDIKNFDIITNGTLLNKSLWLSLPEDFRNKVTKITVSLDSFNESTYSILRKGADFSNTFKNIKFISELKNKKEISEFGLSFVIQKKNIEELPQIIKSSEDIGADIIVLNKVEKWRNFGQNYYEKEIGLPINWRDIYKNIISETEELIKKTKIKISSNILKIN